MCSLRNTKHHHRKESVHFPRNCALWPSTRTTDAQTFSKHIPNIWPDFDRFGHISQNFVTVLSVHEFHDDKSFFLQKVKIFIHLKGIYKYILGFGVWVLAIQNLRLTHHASIVREVGRCLQGTATGWTLLIFFQVFKVLARNIKILRNFSLD